MTRVVIGTKFERLVKKLRKRYPHIMRDIEPLIAQLENGTTPGDQLQGLPYAVYKVRVQNSDAQRGKSGGYRVLYFVRTADTVYLIAIYSKSDLEDLPDALIIDAIVEALEDDDPKKG
ncbi:MAG: type II toxin-antitoxin system RelE/ParE family toxin [Anaerolineae bacterium]|nr:type II toxin-antitoxin system RelE/ParE family toxin [Anaerolineae bacterium]